jgi:hypothetical protein
MFKIRLALVLVFLAAMATSLLLVRGGTARAEKEVSLGPGELNLRFFCGRFGGLGLKTATFALEGSPFVMPDLTLGLDFGGSLDADRTVTVAPEAGTAGGRVRYEVELDELGWIATAHVSVPDDWQGSLSLVDFRCNFQGPPPADACSGWSGRIVLRVNQHLGNPGTGLLSKVEVLPTNDIPVNILGAGTYEVTLKSFDEHSSHGGQGQQHERWYAVFQTEQGPVATQPIDDLPDAQDALNQEVGRITLPGRASSMGLVHERSGGTGQPDRFETPESVTAVCIALDSVSAIPAFP